MPHKRKRSNNDEKDSATPQDEKQAQGKEVVVAGAAGAKKAKPERNIRIEIPLAGQAGDENGVHLWLPSVVLAVGAPGLGKTHMGRYMLYQMAPYVEHGLVICCNPVSADEWDCVPKKFVTRTYSIDLIKAFMKDQEANGFPLAFLFVDDFIGNVDLDDPVWRELCTQFRKYKVFLWFGCQYLARAVPPVIRQCAQFVYLFRTTEFRSLRVLHDSFLSAFFRNPGELEMALMNAPSKHHCLYMDVRDMKLNMVLSPSPDELPDFFITWDARADQDEHEDMYSGEKRREGQLPDDLKRLEATEKARKQYEQQKVGSAQPLVQQFTEVDEQTRAAAHAAAPDATNKRKLIKTQNALEQSAEEERTRKVQKITVDPPQEIPTQSAVLREYTSGQKRKLEVVAPVQGSKRMKV